MFLLSVRSVSGNKCHSGTQLRTSLRHACTNENAAQVTLENYALVTDLINGN